MLGSDDYSFREEKACALYLIGKVTLGIVPHEGDKSRVWGGKLLARFELRNSSLLLILILANYLVLILFARLLLNAIVNLVKLLWLCILILENVCGC